eukprot:gene4897-3505_t
MEEDPSQLFKGLNDELYSQIDQQYFQEPRDFKSLVEVLNVLESRVDQIIYQNRVAAVNGEASTSGYEAGNSLVDLQKQLEIVKRVIEDVVTFQQGGMNNSLDTMREVVKEYCRGREEIQRLRKSLAETQTVLTAKKTGQISLRELWLKKAELQESLRLVRDIEELKNVPHKVFRLMQQRRYYAAVLTLNSAVEKMFGEDLVGVGGLVQIREAIMDLKENLLDACVQELREQIVGPIPDFQFVVEKQDASESASIPDMEAQSDNGGTTTGGGGGGGSSAFVGVGGGPAVSESGRRPSHHRASFSEYAPSRYAGSVAGDVPSPLASYPSFSLGSNNALWPQYRDLRDVDEQMEAALVDPSTAGPVYMRLLVKTVGALKCEEDVERLIFETIFSRFQSFVIQVREVVFKRRQDQFLSDDHHGIGNGNGGDYDEAIWMLRDGKAFAQFVASLLESTSGIVARLMYVWTLLTIHRLVRTGVIDLSMVSSPTVQDVPRPDRDKARQLVFTIWHDLEDKVWLEIFRHLADPEILKISDAPVTINGSLKRLPPSNPQASYNSRGGGGSGGSVPQLSDYQPLLLFHPSSSHAAAVYHKVMSYNALMQRIFKEYGLDTVFFGGGSGGGGGSGDTSSTKAPVNPFKSTASAAAAAPPQTILQLTRNQDAQRKLQEQMLSRITEPLQAFLESELIPIIQSSVNEDMRAMQLQPAEYFQPTVIQAHARERTLFHAEALVRYWQQLSQHRTMVSVVLDRLVRGFAASAKDHVENLTWNWQSQMLIQDKATYRQLLAMVEDDVVYAQYYTQRVLQGKLSLEDLLLPVTYTTHSTGHATGYATMMGGAKSMLLGGGGGGGDAATTAASASTASFARAAQRSLSQYYAQEFAALHAQTAVWDLAGHANGSGGGGGGYVLNDTKALAPIQQGGSALSGVACVAAACDWLIHRLVSVYNAMMKKVLLANHHYHSHASASSASSSSSSSAASASGRPMSLAVNTSSVTMGVGGGRRPSGAIDFGTSSSSSSSNNHNNSNSNNPHTMEHIQQMKESLTLALKEVQRLSKASLLFLRHAVQTLCFYYLQKLIHVNFLTSTAAAAAGSAAAASGSETAAEDSILSVLLQQLHMVVDALSTGYVLSFSGSTLVPSVVGPIVSLIPRLLMRCVLVIVQLAPSATVPISSGGPGGGGGGGMKPSGYSINKTRLLRLVVSAQQLLVSFLNQKLGISDGESKRRLLEVLSEESERVRKVASLIEAPASEIRQYLKKVAMQRELDKELARTLWMRATERAGEGSFEEVWRDLELSRNGLAN